MVFIRFIKYSLYTCPSKIDQNWLVRNEWEGDEFHSLIYATQIFVGSLLFGSCGTQKWTKLKKTLFFTFSWEGEHGELVCANRRESRIWGYRPGGRHYGARQTRKSFLAASSDSKSRKQGCQLQVQTADVALKFPRENKRCEVVAGEECERTREDSKIGIQHRRPCEVHGHCPCPSSNTTWYICDLLWESTRKPWSHRRKKQIQFERVCKYPWFY